jgi:hypothetical protein
MKPFSYLLAFNVALTVSLFAWIHSWPNVVAFMVATLALVVDLFFVAQRTRDEVAELLGELTRRVDTAEADAKKAREMATSLLNISKRPSF